MIAPKRSSAYQAHAVDDGIRPPGKNWPQDFCKIHLELTARRVRPLDWARYDQKIHIERLGGKFRIAFRNLFRQVPSKVVPFNRSAQTESNDTPLTQICNRIRSEGDVKGGEV